MNISNHQMNQSQPAKRQTKTDTGLHHESVGGKDAAVFTSHMRNKYSFLKDIHIQNDENVFFLFIYLIFIYFYKIKKIYETKS